MKVGDRLICKKNFTDLGTAKSYGTSPRWDTKYIKHEKYIITSVDLSDRFGSYFSIEHIQTNPSWFYFEKPTDKNWKHDIHFYYAWDYFYTEKEIRKLKLEEINESW